MTGNLEHMCGPIIYAAIAPMGTQPGGGGWVTLVDNRPTQAEAAVTDAGR